MRNWPGRIAAARTGQARRTREVSRARRTFSTTAAQRWTAAGQASGRGTRRPLLPRGLAAGDRLFERLEFRPRQAAGLALGQPVEPDRADRLPLERQHLVPELGEHPPDLAILTLGQHDPQPRALALPLHPADVAGARRPPAPPDTPAPRVEGGLGRGGPPPD